jgi:metallophosphoesterase (TIGR00282 family)
VAVAGTIRLLFVGDVVGPAGRDAARALIPQLRRELAADAVVVNAENSADAGFGVTAEAASELLQVADLLTLGDHAFDQPGTDDLLNREARITRPANVGQDRAGRAWGVVDAAGVRVGVVTLQGQVFMKPLPESPFAAVDRALEALEREGARAMLVEIHAEATSEKQAMGWHCAGRAALVVGTHTHVATADGRVLPGGTAFLTDAGMTGARDSIIGFERDGFLRFIATGERSGMPPRPGTGVRWLNGVLVEIEPETGRARRVETVTRTIGE